MFQLPGVRGHSFLERNGVLFSTFFEKYSVIQLHLLFFNLSSF